MARTTNTPVLSADGRNLVLVNPEFFREQERLREEIRQKKSNAIKKFESPLFYNAPIEVTFVRFPKLPKELRNMIWEEFIRHESRVLEFSFYRPRGAGAKRDFLAVSKAGAPPSLVVCSESREIGLKRYERLSFQGSSADDAFINWDRDVVLLHANQEWRFICQVLQDNHSDDGTPINEVADSAAGKAGKNSLVQQINRRTRNLAIHHNAMEEMLNFISHNPSVSLLPAVEHFMVIFDSSTLARHEEGKISFTINYTEPESPQDSREVIAKPLSHRIDSRPSSDYHITGSWVFKSLASKFPMISTVVASRNDTLLLTRGEKRDRRRVKEGRMTKAALEEKKKVKTEAALAKLSPKRRASVQNRMDTKKAEEERKDRVLTDAELAAKLQLEFDSRGGRDED